MRQKVGVHFDWVETPTFPEKIRGMAWAHIEPTMSVAPHFTFFIATPTLSPPQSPLVNFIATVAVYTSAGLVKFTRRMRRSLFWGLASAVSALSGASAYGELVDVSVLVVSLQKYNQTEQC